MKEGDRLQYVCGHWLIAGPMGIQDYSVRDVPFKKCAACQRRLERAAPLLLNVCKRVLVDVKAAIASKETGWEKMRDRLENVIKSAEN